MTRRLFVLDHNFPGLAVEPFIPEVEFKALQDIDPWLTRGVDDWATILGLHQFKSSKIHGFVTCDDGMLNLSRTIPVLMQTDLTLLVCAKTGHDPIAATGLVLLHAPYIAARWTEHPELVVVRHPGQKANEVEDRLETLIGRTKMKRGEYLRANELTREQLETPLKDWYVPSED